jgi:NADH-quinone oxidoreductase subunit L
VNAAYVIVALPLAGFALLLWLGRRLGDPLAGWAATLMAAGSFAASVVTYAALLGKDDRHRLVVKQIFTWIPVAGLHVNAALQLDPLSVTMALFVTGVGSLIHLYSIGYMKGDERFSRFFVLLNLFLFSMLCLVLADNFLFTFLGWEGVGLCSYQLISFWFERNTAAVAGKKAFVTNRVGDFGFMIAMFLIFSRFGSLTYRTVFSSISANGLSRYTATAIALLLFLGAVGKSAQLPLYVWLPDAMEGPTPVSALIHAATMVTAGVFLMARISPILQLAPGARWTVAIVGAVTALFAATIACAQDDIKKVLAYSTISQLGYMFLAIGASAYVAGLFHMVTHAFFKALLFLGAGAVIHGLHDQQDMKKMGALGRWMPVTFVTFVAAWLAISGIPPFAGFWSKDDILALSWHQSPVLWAVGVLTAGLTAYYMSRQVALVFLGEAHWSEHGAAARGADAGAAASGADSEAGHDGAPHEAPWTMRIPLIVLGLLSVVGGVINLPVHNWDFLARWLDPVIGVAEPHVSTAIKWMSFGVTLALCIAGVIVGLSVWLRNIYNDRLEPAILRRAWLVDDTLSAFVRQPGTAMANFAAYVVDARVVDGAVNGVAALVRETGQRLRKLQTGYVRNYALGVAAGTAVILGYIVFRAGG